MILSAEPSILHAMCGRPVGYFAVTGHWIEEKPSGEWKLEHALLGFTLMNTAHNGVRLGQALYKICDRLKIVHKVCFHFVSLS